MMNKTDASTKYLSTLQRQLSQNQESIQLNSKIGTFLINEGRIEEAIPYYMKIIELGSKDPETRKKLLVAFADIRERKTTGLIDNKYAAVSQSTMFEEGSRQHLSELMQSLEDGQSKRSNMELARYSSGKRRFPTVDLAKAPSSSKTVLITRRMGERIAIDNDVEIAVLDVDRHAVRLQLEVPVEKKISQDQSYLGCCDANRNAMMTSKNSLIKLRNRIGRTE